MPGIPNPVSDKSTFFGAAWNQSREALRSHQPLSSPGELLGHTVHGVIREQPPALPPYGGAALGLTTLRVKSVVADDSGKGNVLVCRTWNGTTEGASDVFVAKHFTAQQPASETLDGIVITYTYSGAATDLNRTRAAAGTGVNETQQVVPLWTVNGLITVAEVDYSGVTKGGADLKLMEVSARCWAQV